MRSPARNILIIKHGAFGDIIQSEGAFRDIRENHAGATITALTAPAYAKILERCPWIDRVMIDPRPPRWRLGALRALRRKLRDQRFDIVYDLQNSSRTAFYYRWFLRGTPWSGTAPGCSHPHRAPNPKAIPSLERFAGQLRDAGLTVRHTLDPDVSWMADNVAPVLAEAGIAEPYIVLIPGSSARHPHKRWPHYADLARRLIADGFSVVTVPGPDEIELCRGLPATALPARVVIDGNFLNWFQLAGVLKGAAFVVGNDTGPSHLAAHLGVPGLALFGSHTAAALTGIERPRFGVLEVDDLAALGTARVHDALRAALES